MQMQIDPDKKFGTRECPGCATVVERNHNWCPICHYEFPVEHPARRMIIWLTALILLIIILAQLLSR